jgi:hypothetical protein
LPLFAAQSLELFNACSFPKIVAEDRYVDVLGEAFDEPKPLGQGGSTFEQQPWLLGEAIEEGIKCPTDPEVLFNILRCRTDALGRGCEEASTSCVVSRQDRIEVRIHCAPCPGVRMLRR